MHEDERVKDGVGVVVDDEQEMDMIRHDDKVTGCQSGIEAVQCPQHFKHLLARFREHRPCLLVHEPGKDGPPLVYANGKKEELPPPMPELKLHNRHSIHGGSGAEPPSFRPCSLLKPRADGFCEGRQIGQAELRPVVE